MKTREIKKVSKQLAGSTDLSFIRKPQDLEVLHNAI